MYTHLPELALKPAAAWDHLVRGEVEAVPLEALEGRIAAVMLVIVLMRILGQILIAIRTPADAIAAFQVVGGFLYLATFLWLKNRQIPARLAAQYPGVHRLLLNKYYVDEIYDATIVQPIKVVSTEGLWRGFDVKVVDGAVNGAGYFVSGVSVVLRLLQNGSVKTYAASMFVGAVAVLAYYLWR